MKPILFITSILASIMVIQPAFAERKPMSTIKDKRMKIVNYVPEEIYKITSHTEHYTRIVFAPYEYIEEGSWNFGIEGMYDVVLVKHNVLMIKPLVENSGVITNFFVMSNLRPYDFEIHSHKARSRRPKDMTYRLKFNYPLDKAAFNAKKAKDKKRKDKASQAMSVRKGECQIHNMNNANYDYTVEGDLEIKPQMIFDNDQFTYIKMNKEYSSIKSVDKDGTARMVNYHKKCGYMVVENVYDRLSLIKDDQIVCLRNKAFNKNPKHFIKEEEGV